MTIKLDMPKAYDRVEWKYLEVAMEGLGFDECSSNLVISCIFSITYKVLLTQWEVEKNFYTIKGIETKRHHCHHTSFLFVPRALVL